MEPPKPDFASDLLEQAHLAYTRKQFAEARLMVDTLVIAHPDDREAADLYARVVAAQVVGTGQSSLPWNRDIISKSAGQAFIFGLGLFAFGIITATPAIRAGFAQGFGPHTTVIVDGNKPVQPVYPCRNWNVSLLLVGHLQEKRSEERLTRTDPASFLWGTGWVPAGIK